MVPGYSAGEGTVGRKEKCVIRKKQQTKTNAEKTQTIMAAVGEMGFCIGFSLVGTDFSSRPPSSSPLQSDFDDSFLLDGDNERTHRKNKEVSTLGKRRRKIGIFSTMQ